MKTTCSFLLLLSALLMIPKAQASTLASNLGSSSAGVETVSSSTWIAGSFGTAASAWNLSSVTLLMSAAPATSLTIELYSDNSTSPGYELAAFAAASSYSASLAPVTFAGNYKLAANTTYWVVMQAGSGQAQWAYTASSTGAGSGFLPNWAETLDAGSNWFSFNSYPMMMSVDASAVPEPASIFFVLLAAVSCGVWSAVRRRQRTA